MKWFKKFEDFQKEKELEIETPIDDTPNVATMDADEEELSKSFIDPKGVIHIEDWDKY